VHATPTTTRTVNTTRSAQSTVRGRLALAVVLALSMATPASAALQAPTAAAATASPADATPATAGADPVVAERVTLDRTPDDPGTVTVTVEYSIPSTVDALRVETPFPGFDEVAVAELDGFDREDEGRFEWDGSTRTASVVLEYAVDDEFGARSLGVERRDWAFAYLPEPDVEVDAGGDAVAVEREQRVAGDGHATVAFGLDGAVATERRRAGGATLTVVVAPGARPRTELDEFAALYRFGGRELAVGDRPNDTAVFVLPDAVFDRGSPAGTTVNRSVWLQDRFSDDDDLQSIPAHEYVHTRLGSFGDDDSRWLTEATAEYYGYLFSLNRANGDWAAFRDALTVDRQRVRESTLTERFTWASPFVPYQKGPRVLAALDAEIRARTGGDRTLQDVLAYRDRAAYGDLRTYENFSAAVVAVTDDAGMGRWLDRYVDGDELPPLPAEPDRFVVNDSIDSDGDGVPNGEEVETNPFDADTDDDGVPDGEDESPAADGAEDDSASPPEDGERTATTTRGDGAADTASGTATTNPQTGASVTTAAAANGTDPGSTSDAESGADDVDSTPGFGAAMALAALAALALGARARR